MSISVWDQNANAEAYARSTSPHVLKAVANVVEGTPQMDIYAVPNSTFHKSAAPRCRLTRTGFCYAERVAMATLS